MPVSRRVCARKGVKVSCVLKDNGNHRNQIEGPVLVRLLTKSVSAGAAALCPGRTRSPGFRSSAD